MGAYMVPDQQGHADELQTVASRVYKIPRLFPPNGRIKYYICRGETPTGMTKVLRVEHPKQDWQH